MRPCVCEKKKKVVLVCQPPPLPVISSGMRAPEREGLLIQDACCLLRVLQAQWQPADARERGDEERHRTFNGNKDGNKF